MYRAVTLKVLRDGISLADTDAIRGLMERTEIELENPGGTLKVRLDGAEVSDAIRSERVTSAVSAVSRLKDVRTAMVREQRRAAIHSDIVAEGRDIGTVVFPDADLKFFVVARLEARARRRQAELAVQGILADYEDTLEALRQRDLIDSTRDESPLLKAADAIEIDTSDMTIDEQVAVVVTMARERLERIKRR